MQPTNVTPNHHAEHAPFTGALGVVAALSMVAGREDDARLAVDLSGLSPGEVVLDIGCGPAAAVRRATRLGARAIGVDPAPVMLGFARVLTRRNTVSFRRGAAEQLPVEDDEADVVWSIATVHHWRDIDAALDEVRRVLVPAGRFVAIEHHTHEHARGLGSQGWTRAQAESFAEYCEAHGFVDVRVAERSQARRPAIAVVARQTA